MEGADSVIHWLISTLSSEIAARYTQDSHSQQVMYELMYSESLPEISGHGPIFSVYSSVYAIVEVNGRRWELGIKHRR